MFQKYFQPVCAIFYLNKIFYWPNLLNIRFETFFTEINIKSLFLAAVKSIVGKLL